MVVFNNRWGETRLVQINSPSNPLEGVECVGNPEGKPFAVVHGYDRDWDVKSFFEFRYRFDGDFDLEGFRKWNAEVVKNLPVPRRGLRSPRLSREVTAGLRYQMPYSGRVFKRKS